MRNAYREANEAMARFSVPEIIDTGDIRADYKKLEAYSSRLIYPSCTNFILSILSTVSISNIKELVNLNKNKKLLFYAFKITL
jgi:hypothetical protein|tara:strand:+ start:3229 stop:3477 length:249 start_codon:yes stop_codon:yes gene_type:complete